MVQTRRSGVTYRCQISTSGSDESVLIDVEKSSYASLPYWMRHRAYEGALRVGVIAEGLGNAPTTQDIGHRCDDYQCLFCALQMGGLRALAAERRIF